MEAYHDVENKLLYLFLPFPDTMAVLGVRNRLFPHAYALIPLFHPPFLSPSLPLTTQSTERIMHARAWSGTARRRGRGNGMLLTMAGRGSRSGGWSGEKRAEAAHTTCSAMPSS
eukprot:3671745-Rhodomonas_salina.1